MLPAIFTAPPKGLSTVLALLCCTVAFGSSPTATDASAASLLEQAVTARDQSDYVKALELLDTARAAANATRQDQLVCEIELERAILFFFTNELDRCRATAEVGLSKARSNGIPNLEAGFLNVLANMERKMGNAHAAIALFEDALNIHKQLNQFNSAASIANNIGITLFAIDEFEAAAKWYEFALAQLDDKASKDLKAAIFSNQAEVFTALDRFSEAQAKLEQSLQLEREINNPYDIAYTYFNFGELFSRQQKYADANAYYQKALDIQLTLDTPYQIAETRHRMAKDALAQDDPSTALILLNASFTAVQELDTTMLLADYCDAFAETFNELGNPERARFYQRLSRFFRAEFDGDTIAAAPTSTSPTGNRAQQAPSNALQRWSLPLLLLLVCIILGWVIFENVRMRQTLEKHHIHDS